ncbi:hypothetical protein DLJ53_17825 [Acuticoccus sediminis]|uniref:Uncharacterized protein n=1 Tax=Acuticoccus sediminis TaxID=2184697 RepID=A0A8B2NUV0_9HYPH|nr:hypothetical protein [Acuticoccus sediminis]RAI01075.1 hypothetical protein DLJ53_17825 [Acuticoccus sediminis]
MDEREIELMKVRLSYLEATVGALMRHLALQDPYEDIREDVSESIMERRFQGRAEFQAWHDVFSGRHLHRDEKRVDVGRQTLEAIFGDRIPPL